MKNFNGGYGDPRVRGKIWSKRRKILSLIKPFIVFLIYTVKSHEYGGWNGDLAPNFKGKMGSLHPFFFFKCSFFFSLSLLVPFSSILLCFPLHFLLTQSLPPSLPSLSASLISLALSFSLPFLSLLLDLFLPLFFCFDRPWPFLVIEVP